MKQRKVRDRQKHGNPNLSVLDSIAWPKPLLYVPVSLPALPSASLEGLTHAPCGSAVILLSQLCFDWHLFYIFMGICFIFYRHLFYIFISYFNSFWGNLCATHKEGKLPRGETSYIFLLHTNTFGVEVNHAHCNPSESEIFGTNHFTHFFKPFFFPHFLFFPPSHCSLSLFFFPVPFLSFSLLLKFVLCR